MDARVCGLQGSHSQPCEVDRASGGRRGIRVNCVSPGDILFEGGTWADARDNNEKLYNAILRENPFRRLGTPEEIADVVTFVASERASFMTGSNVLVDGGATSSLQL